MSDYKFIKFTLSPDEVVATIALNRPKKLNALSTELLAEIEQCVTEKVNAFSSKVRVVVLVGAGKHFTAGTDLQSETSALQSLGSSADEDGQEDPARKAIQLSDTVVSRL